MKVIDIANKIDKNEIKLPIRLKLKNDLYCHAYIIIYETKKAYWEDRNGNTGTIITFDDLFREIEIIEEKKEIEKINYYQIRKNEIAVDYIENNETKHFCLNKKEKYFVDKINELVREFNKLKKDK